MADKKRGLNKGLNALLGDALGGTSVLEVIDRGSKIKTKKKPVQPPKKMVKSTSRISSIKKNNTLEKIIEKKPVAIKPSNVKHVAPSPESPLQFVLLEKIRPGRFQPRRDIVEEELIPLADSIRAQGVLQPIVVRPPVNGIYEIIAGERRFRASKLAGLLEIPAIVKAVPDQAAMAIALIENIQRENLNPVEEALALERLVKEFALTHAEVAEAVGKSRATVTNLLRLLTLNEDVRVLLEQKALEAGHAKVLLGAPSELQSILAKQVVLDGLSVRQTEVLLHQTLNPTEPPPVQPPLLVPHKRSIDPDIRRLQISLSEKIGSIVRILHSPKGKGRLVIRYHNLDELEGILAHIQ